MKLAKWASAAFAGAMMMAAPSAGAVVVLDQLSTVTQPASFGGFSTPIIGTTPFFNKYTAVQTITAGTKGKLNSVHFPVLAASSAGTLVLSLIDGDYNNGPHSLIGQQYFDFSQFNEINTDPNNFNYIFDVSLFNYNVKSGQTFSIFFDTAPSTNSFINLINGYTRSSNINNPFIPTEFYLANYSGGSLTTFIDGTPFFVTTTAPYDLTFATYVDTSGAVPEPATWSLLILGFGGIGVAMRRRAKRAAALVA